MLLSQLQIILDPDECNEPIRLSYDQCLRLETKRYAIDTARSRYLSNDLEVLILDAHQPLELGSTVQSIIVVKGTVEPLDGQLLDQLAIVKMPDLGLLQTGTSYDILGAHRSNMVRLFAVVAEQGLWQSLQT